MRKTTPAASHDRQRRTLAFGFTFVLGGCGLLRPEQSLAQREPPRLDVPYVPTPQPVVDKMLEMAGVNDKDTLYDLGCGDGRIVVTAASKHGARGVGIDIDPQRITEARENARKAGVANRVQFRNADLFASDFSPATVVTLYLLPQINLKLRPQLWKQLRVGTRVVSHAFDMGDEWPPERKIDVAGKTIYRWTIREQHKRAKA
ncbi:MAG TPA: class I SAM-dependent methyltransferase [Ramlibacter sp.]|nr:class I SAM-dependent methyltransferase [Ramlibacter sp.]